jgi:hypothetical protein
MARLKCKKCGAVFEYEYKVMSSLVHVGPYKIVKCPACEKNSFVNVYSSVKDPLTWPEQEKRHDQQIIETQLTEEEQEKKRIEESKYEKA